MLQGDIITDRSYFYIIVSGKARVVQDGACVCYRGTGEYFGERGLIANEPRSADVLADGHMRALSVSRAAFKRCLLADGRYKGVDMGCR
jgi:CRP-like cAMP-binding protein